MVTTAYKIVPVVEAEQWNDAVRAAPRADMLQSWQWGEFRREYGGWGVARLMALRDDEPLAGAQILSRRVSGVPFLYAPRGPWWRDDDALRALLGWLRRKQAFRAPLLRADPLVTDDKTLRALGFWPSPQQIQPRATILVDLARSDDAIMESFDRQVRYNARHALKKGVEVAEGGIELVRDFWGLLNATAERKGFVERSVDYYEQFLRHFGSSARVFLARYEGETVYGAVLALFGQRAYYLYGASGGDRSVKPSELTQYRAMLWAKSRGATLYDMWGVPTHPTEEHPLYGTYRFKAGFGGVTETYAGAFDLPLTPLVGRASTLVETLALKSRSLARGQGFRIVDHLA
jgi:peptidoglycan pentaglycine glycine transferase (the first glycine)